MSTRKSSSYRNFKLPKTSRSRTPFDRECLTVRTTGETFDDGATIELIRAPTGPPLLMLSDGQSVRVARQVEFRGKMYIPVHIDHSILLAVGFPTRRDHFGSTTELFTKKRETFMSYGFSEDVALPITYFSFSTWFPDFLPAAPCLLLTGPPAEARLLLELLGCTVRHPFPLGQIQGSSLCSLPMDIRPTLLINQIKNVGSACELLDISNHRCAYIPKNQRLVNVYCSKAIYLGEKHKCGNYGDSVLRINVHSLSGRFPILHAKDRSEITGEFQSKMLDYRCRNIFKVHESICDFPEFGSEIRILARILGAPIVEAPELQADLEPLLRDCQERALEARSCDPDYVTIEALLFHCHRDLGQKVYVRRITRTVMGILKARGETLKITPEEIGKILRKHRFSPKRDGDGSALRLSDGVCSYTHQLAQRFQLKTWHKGITRCSFCLQALRQVDRDQQK